LYQTTTKLFVQEEEEEEEDGPLNFKLLDKKNDKEYWEALHKGSHAVSAGHGQPSW
jgi:hypothetical protein